MLQYSAVVGQEKRGDIKISIYFVCDSADGTLEDCDKIFFSWLQNNTQATSAL